MAKNEAPIITRAVKSAAKHVDSFLLVDTGSTDGTEKVFMAACSNEGKAATVRHTEWRDFGTTRTEVYEIASRVYPDHYLLILDADDQIEALPRPDWLLASAYRLKCYSEGNTFYYPRLLKPGIAMKYVGVTHEYLDLPLTDQGSLCDSVYRLGFDSIRRAEGRKDLEDYELLKNLKNKTPRDVFYLAQTAALLGRTDEAKSWYARRVSQSAGSYEERYVACVRLAKIYLAQGDAFARQTALTYASLGSQLRPHRKECWLLLSRWNLLEGGYQSARKYADRCMAVTNGVDQLFVDDAITVDIQARAILADCTAKLAVNPCDILDSCQVYCSGS